MPVSLETWLGYEEEYRAVQGRIASARAEGDVDALNPLHAERHELLARASTALPARGPVTAWMIEALDEASPELSERSEFACRVIEHRRQFPRVYLGAVVRAGARFGHRGSGFIELASHAHGQELVLRAPTVLAGSQSMAHWFISRHRWQISKLPTLTQIYQIIRC